MHIRLAETQANLPLPATTRWPDGVWDIEAFAHGSMSVILFSPRGSDHQLPHEQDELYVVVKGCGTLVVDDRRSSFGTGDVLFVPANSIHRFEDFSSDLVTWAVFWGPKGGE